MGYRQFVIGDSSEFSNQQAATLPATGSVNVNPIYPTKSGNRNIIGVVITIAVTLSNTGATLASFTAGSMITELKITKGSTKLIDIASEDQLEKLFHILTGLPIGQGFNTSGQIYFNNPATTARTSAGSATATEVIYLPLNLVTADVPPIFTLSLNNYASVAGGTSGTATFQIEFEYSDQAVQDDYFRVVTAPAALGTSTDIDITQYFAEQNPVDEVWVEYTADADLSYESFQFGNNVVYQQAQPQTLITDEVPSPLLTHIAGFFKMKAPSGTVYQTQGSTATAAKLINNLVTSRTPTFYLRLSATVGSPAPVSPVAASAPYYAPVNQTQATQVAPPVRARRRTLLTP